MKKTTMNYSNRQNWDLDAWPEMYAKLKELQGIIFTSPPGFELNMMTFTVASLAAGCRHCQAHGAYGLDRMGLSLNKIQAIWSFETSDLFSERERAALSGLGWNISKHVGEGHEQRAGPPGLKRR